jgi:hypothetical protein
MLGRRRGAVCRRVTSTRPSGAVPVVVIGQLADGQFDSIINQAEELAAIVAEVLLDGAAYDSVI